jgi:DNA replication protein DnaC
VPNTSTANMPGSSVSGNECPVCHGAGYLLRDVPVGDPNFGRLFPCECKVAELEARQSRAFSEMSGLDLLERWTFDSFDANVPGVREAYEICLEFAQNPDGWILLKGPYGCGKTHLAAAVANLVPLFTVVPDLLDYLRSTFAPDSEATYPERFHQIRQAGLLVLDDLGTENGTPWATEKLFQIVNYRYNQRKPTIITTNRDLDRLDPRILSRIMDAEICRSHIYIDAGDYRVRRSRLTRQR